MFTGIVEDLGTIVSIEREAQALALIVRTGLDSQSIRLGDSIAVNGVCLTVAGQKGDVLSFDVSHETHSATTLSRLGPGDGAHLERALSFGGRLGGHLVTGHVDGVGEVTRRSQSGPNVDLEILAPSLAAAYLVSKGSVAIDGVSLTVNQPRGKRFQVTLVPHTLEKTLLGARRAGDRVNIEADILGKYVRHFSGASGGASIDEDFLKRHGFL
jgi:riboflavin synthase